MTRNTDNITGIETIVKKSIEGRHFFKTKLNYDKKKNEILEEFIALSNDTPDINISSDECYCPESSKVNDEIEDPYSYRTIKYTCARTGKISRRFEYPSDYDETRDDEYPVLIKRFFNGCQLRESIPIPDGGDCGFSLMSSIVRNDHKLILKINELREHIDLEPLFYFKNKTKYLKRY